MPSFQELNCLSIFILSILFSANATSAIAADEKELWEYSLEELKDIKISVASAFDESELVVGSTISHITSADWERRGSKDLYDVLAAEPGIYSGYVYAGSKSISVRGFMNAPGTRGIPIMVDGVALLTNDLSTSLYDTYSYRPGAFSRVEMIRGPGSALYGADAFLGVVSLHTYEHKGSHFDIETEAGSFSYLSTTVKYSEDINNFWHIDAVASYRDQGDAHQDFVNWDRSTLELVAGERSLEGYAHTANIKLNGEVTEYFSVWGQIFSKGNNSVGYPGLGDQTQTGSNLELAGTRENLTMVQLGFSIALNNGISLEGKRYYWESDNDRMGAQHASFEPIIGIPIWVTIKSSDYHTGNQLLLKQPDNSLNTQWTVGVVTSYSSIGDHCIQADTALGGTSIIKPNCTIPYGEFERQINSFIFQAKTSFMEDTFHVLYGGRVDKYKILGTQKTPRLGLIYNHSAESAIKFLWGNAFRAPSAAESMETTTELTGSENVAPESIDTYEFVVMKQRNNWKHTITAFYSHWSDAISIMRTEDPSDPESNMEHTNSGNNRSRGIEVTLGWRSNDWSLDFNSTYTKSLIDNNHTTEGKEFRAEYDAFPRVIINANVGYTFHQHNLQLYLINRINWDQDAYVARTALGLGDFTLYPEKLDHYFRTDISLIWSPSDVLQVRGHIRNAFNRDNQLSHVWTMPNGATPDEELNFTVAISYEFD